jgi:hypothetical protein
MNRVKWIAFSLTVFMAVTAILGHFTGWEWLGIASVLSAPVAVYISLRYSQQLQA